MNPVTKYTPKYLQLLFQSTPPKEEARLLHGTLKRAPKRIHTDFCIYNCRSNSLSSFSQTCKSVCRAETDGAINGISSAYKNTDTKIKEITTDTC